MLTRQRKMYIPIARQNQEMIKNRPSGMTHTAKISEGVSDSNSVRAQKELIKMQETKCYSASFAHKEQMNR